MNSFSKAATVGTIIALMSLSACVWDRGMGGGGGHDRAGDRGAAPEHDTHDRDNQHCADHGGDDHHGGDCRSNAH